MSVMIDSYGKDKLAWEVVSLSDPDSIRGLLRLRSHYDLLHNRDMSYGLESNVDLTDQLEIVTCTYAWLDDIIASTIFSKQQKSILQRYMDGYDVSDIAHQDEQTTRNINGILSTICRKICEENRRQWIIWVSKNKIETDFKICISCHEELPKTEEFFRVINIDKKNYKNQCRICESIGRKVKY